MVLAFGAGGVTGALGYAHSVLGFGLATVAGFSSCHPILILAGDSSISSICVHGSFRAIGALGYTHSILALGFAAVVGLSSRYPILIFVGDSGVARIRIDRSSSLTIAADGLTAQVLHAILRKQTCNQEHESQDQQHFHLHLRCCGCERNASFIIVILFEKELAA
jgi:hypothetical protein